MDVRDIYFAGGCFWGTEAYLRKLPGIIDTEVGYANSVVTYPTYEQVCSNQTNAAEAVRVRYDADRLPLGTLVQAYLRTVNPTSINHQGNDIGRQYRTGIYWVDEADEPVVREALAALQEKLPMPVAIEARPLENFFEAEEPHQDYLEKHPRGYCHVDLADADAFIAENQLK